MTAKLATGIAALIMASLAIGFALVAEWSDAELAAGLAGGFFVLAIFFAVLWLVLFKPPWAARVFRTAAISVVRGGMAIKKYGRSILDEAPQPKNER